MAEADWLRIEVVLGTAVPVAVSVELPAGATLADAIRVSGLAGTWQPTGIWGRRCPPDTRLRAGDRVEIYVPLVADPKEARRRRARTQRTQKPPVDGSVGSR